MTISKSRRTLIDPIPCFMQIWTGAINAVQNAGVINAEYDTSNQVKISKLNLTTPNGKVVDYGSVMSCLVGEIHGFDAAYAEDDAGHGNHCKYCSTMCSTPASKACDRGGDELIKFKIKMYNHMIKKHNFQANKIDIDKVPKIKDMVC